MNHARVRHPEPDTGEEMLFILNPVAGHGRSRRALDRLRQAMEKAPAPGLSRPRMRPVVWETGRPGHARELAARAAQEGFARIVAVGGDGTVHEVINGLMDAGTGLASRVLLGIVPAGSGNDFARNLGLPADAGAMAPILMGSQWAEVDVGRVNGRHFANLAGVGFDAEVAAWANRVPKFVPGTFTYLAGVLVVLAGYRNARVELELDGLRLARRAFLVAVGNGPAYAGGMRMCPGADMGDGRFRVVVCGDLRRTEILRLLPTIYHGGHVRHPKVEVFDVARLTLEAERPLTVHADGESVGTTPASFQVVAGALRVLGARPSPRSHQQVLPEGSARPAGLPA